jgi:hypothetical protein
LQKALLVDQELPYWKEENKSVAAGDDKDISVTKKYI